MNGWKLVPLGFCASEVRRKNVGGREQNLLSLSYGNIVRKDIDATEGLLPDSFDTYNVVEAGDTVLRLTDLQNDQRSLRVGLVNETGIITSAYVSIRPQGGLEPRFLNYYMKNVDFRKDFYALGAGVRQSLRFDELRRIVVPVPPISVQREIVDFLDEETARIDALIAKKQNLMKLLEERSSSLVADFFMGRKVGVNLLDTMESEEQSAQARPALAPLPAALRRGWRWTRFSSHFTHIDQRTQTGDERLLSVSKIHGVIPRDEISDKPPRAESLVGYKKCKSGDFIVNQMSAYDGLMGIAPMDGIVTYHYLVFRPTDGVNLDFVRTLLTSEIYKQDFSARVRGLGDSGQGQVRTPHIRIGDMLQTVMPLPDVNTQGTIADCIGRELARMRRLESKLRVQAKPLLERRQGLITAVMSGELQIPGLAA